MQQRWREDFFNERQRQVERLHESIRNHQAGREELQLYDSTIKEVRLNVEARFNLCRGNFEYHFPKPESSSPSQPPESLLNSTYNLFEQNPAGRLYDEVLFPSRDRLERFSPSFPKKINTSLEKRRVSRQSRERAITPLHAKSKSKEVQRLPFRQPNPPLPKRSSKSRSVPKQRSNKQIKRTKPDTQKRLMQRSLQRTMRMEDYWSATTKRKLQEYECATKSPLARKGQFTAMGSQSMSRKKVSSERKFPQRH